MHRMLRAVVNLLVLCFSFASTNGVKIVDVRHGEFGSLYTFDYTKAGLRCLEYSHPFILDGFQTCIILSNRPKIRFRYTKGLMAGLFHFESLHDVKKILFIGLGGGAAIVPYQMLCPHAQIDIVEINKDVVDVALEFFMVAKDANTTFYVEDGLEFLARNTTMDYDIVIVDAYISESTADPFMKRNFQQLLRKSLRADTGVALANVILPPMNIFIARELRVWLQEFGFFYGMQYAINLIVTVRADGNIKEQDDLRRNIEKINLTQFDIKSDYFQGMFKIYKKQDFFEF